MLEEILHLHVVGTWVLGKRQNPEHPRNRRSGAHKPLTLNPCNLRSDSDQTAMNPKIESLAIEDQAAMKGMKSSTALKDATCRGPGFFTASDRVVPALQAQGLYGFLGFKLTFRVVKSLKLRARVWSFEDRFPTHRMFTLLFGLKPQLLENLYHEVNTSAQNVIGGGSACTSRVGIRPFQTLHDVGFGSIKSFRLPQKGGAGQGYTTVDAQNSA